MNNLLEIFKDKKRIGFLLGIVVVMIIIIIAISLFVKLIGLKIPYEELEKKLAEATEKYMGDYPNNLPTEGEPTKVVSATTLIEQKYIKELKKYVKDASCTANINVYYENGRYEYQPYLTCNNFKTEKFIDIIKAKNEISSFGEGLYELNNELVYRGQNPNNYLKFADELWRIVKVNNKGQFIIIKQKLDNKEYGYWDDRYNTEKESSKGINTYNLSRALSEIKKIYQEKYNNYSNVLSRFNLCAAKRDEVSTQKDGSIECSYIMENQYIGLLPLYDYMNASLAPNCNNASSRECQNYNFLANTKDKWLTATGNNKNTYSVYYINYAGQIISDDAANRGNYRYILALNKNVLYKSGSGTENDPYIVR